MLLLREVLNILVRNASPRGPMCFRCLTFKWICLFCVLCVSGLFGEIIRNMFGCVCY